MQSSHLVTVIILQTQQTYKSILKQASTQYMAVGVIWKIHAVLVMTHTKR